MSTWLISIAGIVIVGVLVDVMLANSAMSKFVRAILGFFVLFVIVQPIPKFFSSAEQAVESGLYIDLNQELITDINMKSASAFERNCEAVLEDAGYKNVIVTIELAGGMTFSITRVYVNAYGVVLKTEKKDIDIKGDMAKIVASVCGIATSDVLVSV